MTTEQKVKAYDEAIERARKINSGEGIEAPPDWTICEVIFPELKENEDERLRKELIAFLKENHETGRADETWSLSGIERWIAWLEKQGPTVLSNSSNIEKDEQKLANNKVEPKLKIEKGKWYVCDTSRYTDFIVGKAYYCPKNGMLKPNENAMARYVARDCFHLWTVQDAREGDVLIDHCDDYKNPLIFILKKFERVNFGLAQESDYSSYCFLSMSDKPRFKEGYFHHMNDIKPATKKQCDLLFAKMREAGYTFDFETKELKKIHVIDEGKAEMDYCFTKMMNGEKVSPAAWSEEDERMYKGLYNLIYSTQYCDSRKEFSDWLKSIKGKLGGEK